MSTIAAVIGTPISHSLSPAIHNAAFEASVLANRELGYGYYGLALVAMELGQAESGSLYLEKALTYRPALRQKIAIDPAFSQFDF